MSIVTPEFLRG